MIPQGVFGIILGWILQNIKDPGWPSWMPAVIAAVASAVLAALLCYTSGTVTAQCLLTNLVWVFGGSQGYFLATKATGINKTPPFGRPDKKV